MHQLYTTFMPACRRYAVLAFILTLFSGRISLQAQSLDDMRSLNSYGLFAQGQIQCSSRAVSKGRVATNSGIYGNVVSNTELVTDPDSLQAAVDNLSNFRTLLYSYEISPDPFPGFINGISAGVYYCTDDDSFQSPADPSGNTYGSYINDTLTLRGDSSSWFVFNTLNNFAAGSNAVIKLLGNIRPDHIIWHVNGNAFIDEGAQFSGIVVAGGNIAAYKTDAGLISLLAQGDIYLLSGKGRQIFFSAEDMYKESMYHPKFLPLQALNRVALLAGYSIESASDSINFNGLALAPAYTGNFLPADSAMGESSEIYLSAMAEFDFQQPYSMLYSSRLAKSPQKPVLSGLHISPGYTYLGNNVMLTDSIIFDPIPYAVYDIEVSGSLTIASGTVMKAAAFQLENITWRVIGDVEIKSSNFSGVVLSSGNINAEINTGKTGLMAAGNVMVNEGGYLSPGKLKSEALQTLPNPGCVNLIANPHFNENHICLSEDLKQSCDPRLSCENSLLDLGPAKYKFVMENNVQSYYLSTRPCSTGIAGSVIVWQQTDIKVLAGVYYSFNAKLKGNGYNSNIRAVLLPNGPSKVLMSQTVSANSWVNTTPSTEAWKCTTDGYVTVQLEVECNGSASNPAEVSFDDLYFGPNKGETGVRPTYTVTAPGVKGINGFRATFKTDNHLAGISPATDVLYTLYNFLPPFNEVTGAVRGKEYVSTPVITGAPGSIKSYYIGIVPNAAITCEIDKSEVLVKFCTPVIAPDDIDMKLYRYAASQPFTLPVPGGGTWEGDGLKVYESNGSYYFDSWVDMDGNSLELGNYTMFYTSPTGNDCPVTISIVVQILDPDAPRIECPHAALCPNSYYVLPDYAVNRAGQTLPLIWSTVGPYTGGADATLNIGGPNYVRYAAAGFYKLTAKFDAVADVPDIAEMSFLVNSCNPILTGGYRTLGSVVVGNYAAVNDYAWVPVNHDITNGDCISVPPPANGATEASRSPWHYVQDNGNEGTLYLIPGKYYLPQGAEINLFHDITRVVLMTGVELYFEGIPAPVCGSADVETLKQHSLIIPESAKLIVMPGVTMQPMRPGYVWGGILKRHSTPPQSYVERGIELHGEYDFPNSGACSNYPYYTSGIRIEGSMLGVGQEYDNQITSSVFARGVVFYACKKGFVLKTQPNQSSEISKCLFSGAFPTGASYSAPTHTAESFIDLVSGLLTLKDNNATQVNTAVKAASYTGIIMSKNRFYFNTTGLDLANHCTLNSTEDEIHSTYKALKILGGSVNLLGDSLLQEGDWDGMGIDAREHVTAFTIKHCNVRGRRYGMSYYLGAAINSEYNWYSSPSGVGVSINQATITSKYDKYRDDNPTGQIGGYDAPENTIGGLSLWYATATVTNADFNNFSFNVFGAQSNVYFTQSKAYSPNMNADLRECTTVLNSCTLKAKETNIYANSGTLHVNGGDLYCDKTGILAESSNDVYVSSHITASDGINLYDCESDIYHSSVLSDAETGKCVYVSGGTADVSFSDFSSRHNGLESEDGANTQIDNSSFETGNIGIFTNESILTVNAVTEINSKVIGIKGLNSSPVYIEAEINAPKGLALENCSTKVENSTITSVPAPGICADVHSNIFEMFSSTLFSNKTGVKALACSTKLWYCTLHSDKDGVDAETSNVLVDEGCNVYSVEKCIKALTCSSLTVNWTALEGDYGIDAENSVVNVTGNTTIRPVHFGIKAKACSTTVNGAHFWLGNGIDECIGINTFETGTLNAGTTMYTSLINPAEITGFLLQNGTTATLEYGQIGGIVGSSTQLVTTNVTGVKIEHDVVNVSISEVWFNAQYGIKVCSNTAPISINSNIFNCKTYGIALEPALPNISITNNHFNFNHESVKGITVKPLCGGSGNAITLDMRCNVFLAKNTSINYLYAMHIEDPFAQLGQFGNQDAGAANIWPVMATKPAIDHSHWYSIYNESDNPVKYYHSSNELNTDPSITTLPLEHIYPLTGNGAVNLKPADGKAGTLWNIREICEREFCATGNFTECNTCRESVAQNGPSDPLYGYLF
ncbi:MAG: ice-binding family protein, partial [Bacteroidota bacterium]